MRRIRFTFKGAYHHVMNRGIKGENIFFDDKAKIYFLKALREKSKNLKLRILTYCIMDNHYHLILQNSSGMLSRFMKQLNSQYGIYYRKRVGGRGYVFQDRFKSTLIQEDKYIQMAIVYVLLNPVRSGKVEGPWEYKWSSIGEYFSNRKSSFIDNTFTEELLGEKRILKNLLKDWGNRDLTTKKTKLGDVLGEDNFIEKAIKRFNRRRKKDTSKRMRRYEYALEPVEKIIKDFETKKGIKVKEIKAKSKKGKQLRNEFLVLLKDKAGLTYSEIIEYQPFQKLKHSSLGQLYKRTKEKLKR